MALLLFLPALLVPMPVAGEAAAESGSVELLSLQPDTDEFHVTGGPQEGDVLSVTVRQADTDGTWIIRTGDRQQSFVRRDDVGNIMLLQQDDFEAGNRVVYDPAVTFLPADPDMAETLDERGLARVYDLDDGDLRASGTYTRRLGAPERVRIKTPAGTFHAYALRCITEYDFNLANARAECLAAYVPGEGLIFERAKRKVVKLGLFPDTQRHEMQLARADTR